MARKGWDALSDAYRNRLIRKGVSRSAYESGAVYPAGARGHGSQQEESFTKRIARFVNAFDSSDRPGLERSKIRALGVQQGQAYMDYRREMTRLYESGDYQDAETMYQNRDKSIRNLVRYKARDGRVLDGTWWYHGMFGG